MLEGATGRPDAWHSAAQWAARTLADHLGDDWPAKAQRPLGVPIESARTHTLSLIEALELALLLDDVRQMPGFADVRGELVGDRTADRVQHATSQLELAALAQALGWRSQLERVRRESPTPADVSMWAPDGRLDIEVKVLFSSDRTREGTDRGDRALEAVAVAASRAGVTAEGQLPASPDPEHVAEAVEWVELGARLLHAGGVAPGFRRHGFNLDLSSGGPGRGRLTVTAAGEDLLRRLFFALSRKARGVTSAGGGWARIDAFNGLWLMSAWGTLGLAEKLQSIRPSVMRAAGEVGVILCSALGLYPGDVEEDVVLDGCSAALRHAVQPMRAREVLIFGPPGGEGAVADLVELFSARPNWLESSLAARDLPTLAEIVMV